MEEEYMGEAYVGFSRVYDIFMDNIPYQEWAGYLRGLLQDYGVEEGIVAELGCGTGNLTELLAEYGYDMIGIDYSEEMLEMAMEKREKSGLEILYLHQDMRELELYGTVAAVVSLCDSINYIMEEEELLQVFRLVNNYLDPKGVFIFDLNTPYKYEHVLADRTFAENREESSFIWDNYYDTDEGINEYDLTIYVREDREGDSCFRRFDEIHYQKAYELSRIRMLLEKAGMEYVTAYDAFTKEPASEVSERIYVIAREGKQEGKLYLHGAESLEHDEEI